MISLMIAHLLPIVTHISVAKIFSDKKLFGIRALLFGQ